MAVRPRTLRKVKKTVLLDAEMVKWVEDRMGAGMEFARFGHALERGIRLLQEKEQRRAAAFLPALK
ncbi:MAG TPA: hypothetical protein VGB18_00140, partial [Candidatus Thermoplasmatota archaeon]